MSINDFIKAMSDAGCAPAQGSIITPGTESSLIKAEGDKGAAKTLYYSLNHDCTFGRWYSCKTGESDFWVPAKRRGMTAEDKAEHKRISEQARADAEAKKKQEQEAAAHEASETLIFAENASTDHPYLIKKGISPHGLYQSGDLLLVPMRDAQGKLWGLQSINAQGDKRFPKGGKKKGCFHLIGTLGEMLYICEGYATGASVHEATGEAVAVAFDAGNLLPVADALRDKYPDAAIVIAGDNDKTGIEKATQAALVCGGSCVYPETEGQDWNDVRDLNRIAEGLALAQYPTREQTLPQASPASHPVSGGDLITQAEDSDLPSGWYETLIFKDGKGTLDNKSLHNAIVLLDNAPEYAGIFKFNEFKSDTFIYRCPPWENRDEFTVRRVENNDLTMLEAHLERKESVNPGETKIAKAVEAVGLKNKFHPVRDYFDSLKWDGVPRLVTWLKDYAKAVTEPEAYLAKIGTMWLVAGVARVFEPGIKFDHMLVLEGPQDAGKSMLLRTLGTFGRDIEECYYTDSITIDTIEERGSILKLQGNLIIEFPELSGMGKKDQDQIKRWITLQVDEVEVKHRQKTNVLPRQFILAGTYNPMQGEGWMNDPTGGRRFWPVMCGLTLDIAGLKKVREQLWAEAVHLYKQGYKLYIDKDDPVYAMAQAAQAHRAVSDVWIDEVRKTLSDTPIPYWTAGEMLVRIGVPTGKQGAQEKKRIGKIFSQIGYDYKQRRIGGVRCWAWGKKDAPEQMELPVQDIKEITW